MKQRKTMMHILSILMLLGSFIVPIQAAQQKDQVYSKYYPLNMIKTESKNFASPSELEDKFEINLDRIAVKKVFNRKRRYQAIVDNVFNAEILTKPLIKPLKTMDTLYAHPNFISVVKFPPSIKIKQGLTNIKMQTFQYSQNLLVFSPKMSAKMGNIVITAYDYATKQNKVFNFIIKMYSNDNAKYDNSYGLYATTKGDFLSLTTFYREIANVNKVKLLEKYVSTFGEKYVRNKFKHNKAYDPIMIDDVPVYIIRDDKNGNINFYGINFRIVVGDRT